MAFRVKQDATRRVLVIRFEQSVDGGVTWTPVDLTLATAVAFRMRQRAGSKYVTGACSITNPPTLGEAVYTWATGDTDTAATYDGECPITWNDGGVEVIPSDTTFEIIVVPKVSNI